MRILVTGSRFWRHRDLLYSTLDAFHPTVIAHGLNPRGADRMADEWAADRGVECLRWPAEWVTYGKAAGPIRNAVMLAAFEPERVLAFKDDFDFKMERGGTEHMAAISLSSGIVVSVVQKDQGLTDLFPAPRLPFDG